MKDRKPMVGLSNSYVLYPKGFKKKIYHKVFAPNSLTVYVSVNPDMLDADDDSSVVSIIFNTYGIDTKSKAIRIEKEVDIPFEDMLHFVMSGEFEKKEIPDGDVINDYRRRCASAGKWEKDYLAELVKVTFQGHDNSEIIPIETFSPIYMRAEKDGERMNSADIYYFRTFQGEKAKKPWVISIRREEEVFQSFSTGERRRRDAFRAFTTIRMTREEFAELIGCIKKSLQKLQENAFQP